MNSEQKGMVALGLIVVFFAGVFLFYGLFGRPMLQPWWATQRGKAELAQAEQNRQIVIKEANAKKESATLLAQAEVERAKGLAAANKIIG